MQNHENVDIYKLAYDIIEQYFSEEVWNSFISNFFGSVTMEIYRRWRRIRILFQKLVRKDFNLMLILVSLRKDSNSKPMVMEYLNKNGVKYRITIEEIMGELFFCQFRMDTCCVFLNNLIFGSILSKSLNFNSFPTVN